MLILILIILLMFMLILILILVLILIICNTNTICLMLRSCASARWNECPGTKSAGPSADCALAYLGQR